MLIRQRVVAGLAIVAGVITVAGCGALPVGVAPAPNGAADCKRDWDVDLSDGKVVTNYDWDDPAEEQRMPPASAITTRPRKSGKKRCRKLSMNK